MEKVKEEAERYSEYVREKLGDVLSAAVAEVAESRPEDPVDFLAHRLYTSRTQRSIPTACASGPGLNTARPTPAAGIATLRPRHNYGARGPRSRLTRYRPENEMSQIRVKSVRKPENTQGWGNAERCSSLTVSQQTGIFKKLGLEENGKLPNENCQQDQEKERFGNIKTGSLNVTCDQVCSDMTSSVNRRDVSLADDEGFEETLPYTSSSKPLFVHLSLKDHLRDLQCDLFDDCDLT